MTYGLPLLIYDDLCPLCVRFKQGLERWDVQHTISYVPLQDEEVFKVFPQLDPLRCHEKIHYLCESGKILVGGEIIPELLRHYPGIEKMAWLLESEVARRSANFFYEKIEKIRLKIKNDEKQCNDCPG